MENILEKIEKYNELKKKEQENFDDDVFDDDLGEIKNIKIEKNMIGMNCKTEKIHVVKSFYRIKDNKKYYSTLCSITVSNVEFIEGDIEANNKPSKLCKNCENILLNTKYTPPKESTPKMIDILKGKKVECIVQHMPRKNPMHFTPIFTRGCFVIKDDVFETRISWVPSKRYYEISDVDINNPLNWVTIHEAVELFEFKNDLEIIKKMCFAADVDCNTKFKRRNTVGRTGYEVEKDLDSARIWFNPSIFMS